MSLQDVYRLAHTAECRLNMSVARPDRNLRLVVGHLMHYESLRLRIVEIEHDIGASRRAAAAQSQDGRHPRHKPSTEQLGSNNSTLQASAEHNEDVEDDVEMEDKSEESDEDDDGTGQALGLTRFPSGHPRTPALVPDVEYNEDVAEPGELDAVTLEQALKQPADVDLAKTLEQVRKCPCHGHADAPHIENVWELPSSIHDKPGVMRAVAQVAA